MRVQNNGATHGRSSESSVDRSSELIPTNAPREEKGVARAQTLPDYLRDTYGTTDRERAQRQAQSRLIALAGGRELRPELCTKRTEPAVTFAGFSLESADQGSAPTCLSASTVVGVLAAIDMLPPADQPTALARLRGFARSVDWRDAPGAVGEFRRLAEGLNNEFAPRSAATGEAVRSATSDAAMFLNERRMMETLLGFEPGGLPMVCLRRSPSLHALAAPLEEALRGGGFALLSGMCSGVLHDVSITRLPHGGYCWHDTRSAEAGQRRTFTAPTIDALFTAVQNANSRREYDFSITLPAPQHNAFDRVACRIYQHPIIHERGGGARFADSLLHATLGRR